MELLKLHNIASYIKGKSSVNNLRNTFMQPEPQMCAASCILSQWLIYRLLTFAKNILLPFETKHNIYQGTCKCIFNFINVK